MRILERDSKELSGISSQFDQLREDRRRGSGPLLEIKVFYETMPTSYGWALLKVKLKVSKFIMITSPFF